MTKKISLKQFVKKYGHLELLEVLFLVKENKDVSIISLGLTSSDTISPLRRGFNQENNTRGEVNE